jgi:hypothetical protein
MIRSSSLCGSCRGSLATLAKLAFIFAVSGFLAGCVESAGSPPPQAEALLRKDEVKPRSASIALTSVSGVPEPVADRMKKAFAQEAAQREITLADANSADYLMRGYLNAAPTESGTAITVVFDVFDAAKKRALRLEDGLIIKGASADSDPWSAVDVAAISNVAAKSAYSLAAFLANAPEARGADKTRRIAANQAASVSQSSDEAQTSIPRTPPKLLSSKDKTNDLSLAALR